MSNGNGTSVFSQIPGVNLGTAVAGSIAGQFGQAFSNVGGVSPITGAPCLSGKPKGVPGMYAKDGMGRSIYYFVPATGGGLTQAPLGTDPSNFKQVQFYRLYLADDGRRFVVCHKRRSRRTNPLNFRAYKRAAKRVKMTEKVVRRIVRFPKPKLKTRKRRR